MSAPACSAASSVSRVDRPQILTIRGMVSRHNFQARVKAATTGLGSGVTGRVLQRRALLVSPAGPISGALDQRRKALRIAARGQGGGALVGQLRPRLPGI